MGGLGRVTLKKRGRFESGHTEKAREAGSGHTGKRGRLESGHTEKAREAGSGHTGKRGRLESGHTGARQFPLPPPLYPVGDD